MRLSLVLHAHQPPGNFDSVFRRALDTCYAPVLELVDARPRLRLSLHYSGSLLEWLEAHAPDHVAQLRRLVERGQVELVAAGMYEPVLALLPSRDRTPQVLTHRAYLRDLLGGDATTGWLTERVWQQPIAADLADAGIEVVTLDDRHFLTAGLVAEDLDRPWVTEAEGKPLLAVPVAEDLRMLVPWEPVDVAVGRIRDHAAAGRRLLVYADDIEKFGMWPGTYEGVIESGWLAQFLNAVLDLPDVEVAPVGEAARATEPGGRVYLPDGSYPEMLEWSLPAAAQRQFREARAAIEEAGLTERAGRFLRAGNYLQFLAKYPEANHLQKRVADVSARLRERYPALDRADRGDLAAWEPSALPEAQLDLWRAQANCAYWHGLFGGVYLPHIRQRLWHHLALAERTLEDVPLRVFDLDADGLDEAVLQSAALTVVVHPGEGQVVEVTDRRGAVNLVDTLARREEGYHDPAAPPYRFEQARRGVFVDRFLAAGNPPGPRSAVRDRGDFAGSPYEMQPTKRRGAAEVTLERTAAAGGRAAAAVRKRIRLTGRGQTLEAHYRVAAQSGPLRARFAVECNLGLLFTEHPHGTLTSGEESLSLPRGGAFAEVERATLRMEEVPTALGWSVSPPAALDIRPIATVSEAEGLREETPQQLALLLSWPLDLRPGEVFEARIALRVAGGGP